MKGIIGKKVGMTQVYDDKGVLIPVTVIEAGPCVVIGVKTKERDGYSALQVGFGVRKAKNTSQSILGNVVKAGLADNPPAFIREFRSENDPAEEIGSQIKADIFAEGEFLDISGTTKGKGFAGVMKRHHFHGGRDGHGGGWHRKPGSIGCREKPGNVIKGKRMAGQLGNSTRTVQNLRLVKVSVDENLLFVRGAVPGPNGNTVIVKKAKKK
ncbi:MAG: 50S ribosomal protein L3 [Lentisphaerae bacterium ADurb.Bin242]|nr:MAG: 50S ribosomal protein L3 [Lentisphaerae bacterium ADurb.Bin242]